jgi:hypothetical protein
MSELNITTIVETFANQITAAVEAAMADRTLDHPSTPPSLVPAADHGRQEHCDAHD